jgi:hypothetical protein
MLRGSRSKHGGQEQHRQEQVRQTIFHALLPAVARFY